MDMPTAKLGDRVRIQYARVPESRPSSDKARAEKTCEFTVGSKEVFPSLSLGVVGMAPGERKQLTLQPQEAYGPVKAKLIQQIPRQRFPQHIALEVGGGQAYDGICGVFRPPATRADRRNSPRFRGRGWKPSARGKDH